MNFSNVFRKSKRGPTRGTTSKVGWELVVQLTPKASHTKIGEITVDTSGQPYLKVYVTAVPQENKANRTLLVLLSKTFHVPKTSLHIISGLTDRRKVIWFEGEMCPTIRSVT